MQEMWPVVIAAHARFTHLSSFIYTTRSMEPAISGSMFNLATAQPISLSGGRIFVGEWNGRSPGRTPVTTPVLTTHARWPHGHISFRHGTYGILISDRVRYTEYRKKGAGIQEPNKPGTAHGRCGGTLVGSPVRPVHPPASPSPFPWRRGVAASEASCFFPSSFLSRCDPFFHHRRSPAAQWWFPAKRWVPLTTVPGRHRTIEMPMPWHGTIDGPVAAGADI